jgi:hypothetical protein
LDIPPIHGNAVTARSRSTVEREDRAYTTDIGHLAASLPSLSGSIEQLS